MTWLMEILEDYLTVSNKIIRNKSFNIAKNLTYDGYQRGITSTVYIFLKKKTSSDAVKNEVMQKQLSI